jgi:N-formylglutamate deformylase
MTRHVLHIPHASRDIPDQYRDCLLLDEEELQLELIAMTDSWTDGLFPKTGREASRVRFPVSRLVCDPERFVDDETEPMSAKGMGVIYTHTSEGKRLRPDPTLDERQSILGQLYEPHHQRLTRAVSEVLARDGECLVVDCHSFPQIALAYESDTIGERPEICLGIDLFHTPQRLVDRFFERAHRLGLSLSMNYPFSGALVPASFYQADTRVHAFMIEVRRDLYMDETSGEPHSGFDDCRSILASLLEAMN